MRGKTPGEVRGIILSERGFLLRTAAPYTRQKFTNLTQFNNYKLLIDRMLEILRRNLTIPSSPLPLNKKRVLAARAFVFKGASDSPSFLANGYCKKK